MIPRGWRRCFGGTFFRFAASFGIQTVQRRSCGHTLGDLFGNDGMWLRVLSVGQHVAQQHARYHWTCRLQHLGDAVSSSYSGSGRRILDSAGWCIIGHDVAALLEISVCSVNAEKSPAVGCLVPLNEKCGMACILHAWCSEWASCQHGKRSRTVHVRASHHAKYFNSSN